MKIIYPDYENCLTNLTNSILKYFDITPYHTTLKKLDKILEEDNYDNVVLLIYDGMGSNILNRNLDEKSFLRTNKLTDIKAVFPPTTTASTTSLLSGLNPLEHGWLGWDLYFKEIDETVTMFLNTKKDTDILVSKNSIANKYYHYKSIIDLINEKYKAYKLVPFDNNPYSDLEDLNNRIINLCKDKDKKFIYAYYDEPDHTTHIEGTDSDITIKLYEELDKSTKELCDNLKDTNTLVIVTADHGHINSIPITLSDYKDVFNLLKHDISIEGRACAFFIKEGKKQEFEQLFNQYFKDDFILYTKEEVIKNKLFGIGYENKFFKDSIGDYLAVAISNKYFRYNENSVKLVSMHAGLTEDEMLVPLIINKNRRFNNMNYKLIAMDFEGTLLRDDKTISENTKNILKLYKDLGYLIVGVTARTLKSAKDVIPLDIFNYLIINNGVSIYNVDSNEMIYQGNIDKDTAKTITEEIESLCEQIDYVTDNMYYIYINKKNSNLDFIRDISSIEKIGEPVARMNAFLKDIDKVKDYYELISTKYNNVNCFIMQDSDSINKWLVINPKGVNKANTLKELGKMENISLDEMIFFGDGLNDLEVMAEVGLGVAMGNALEEIKDKSKEVTESNNEDGIVKFLDRKLNRQKVKKL